jgi:S-DNA-T family DNA segregation ATPase FtsK/SpoIIIE
MSTTTLVGTPDPGDDNVLPFPNRPTDAVPPGLPNEEAAGETVDRDEVGDDQDALTLVDQPDTPVPTDERPLPERLAALTQARRPILPTWLAHQDELTTVLGWAVTHTGHVAAFHAVRCPVYAGRLAARAPRGLLRSIAHAFGWMFDLEGAPLRADAVAKGDRDGYLRLIEARRDRVRHRLMVAVMTGIVLTAGALVLAGWAPWWAQILAITLTVGVLGWIGTPGDKAVLGTRAVVTHKAQRLTSDVVVRALSALGIAEVNKAVGKGGGGITFPSPITRDGPGWLAEVDLPYGVTVTDILDRRAKLASGLRRPLGCVWPEPDAEQHAGRLRLWVGDQDMRKAKQPTWPLKRSGQSDVFAPIPFGTDQRGRVISVLMMYGNLLLGAMPRQGKTATLRSLLLALALDPNLELRIFELKGTGDLSPLEPVCHHYASGAGDDALEQVMTSLRELYAELETRARRISELAKTNRALVPDNKVTREVSARRSWGLWPIVFAIDECQELFSHSDFKDEADRLCTAIIKRGPALGIMLLLATQRPDSKSLPTGVSANVSLRFCLKVAGQMENDMVLGTSAYQNGIRATQFTPQLDAGIGYLVGATPEPKIVRSFYVDGPGAEKVAVRARALRDAAGTLTGHAIGQSLDTDQGAAISLLTDVLTVIRADEDRVWSESVVDRLAELRPEVYGPWAEQKPAAKATQLAAALKPFGIDTEQVHGRLPSGKTANRRGIARADVAAVHRIRHNTET